MSTVQGSHTEGLGRHLMAVVEYDGTDYHGFQIQANALTVQEALEQALAQVLQEHIHIRYAGRTDTGVHATGQVVDFWTRWDRSLEELHRAWNARLPSDVAIRALSTASEDFHSRYSARSRVYRYSIWNHPIRSPIRRWTHFHVVWRLDVERMAETAQVLIGERDFRTLGAPMRPNGSTVRVVKRVDVWRESDAVFVETEANAFLRRMARRVVAALVDVGQDRMTADELATALAVADPGALQGTAPALGLCLIRVEY